MKRIAIIGAGLSGLVLARDIAARADVTVFEKARGVGGRMSTRYADPFYFDHGAQYFTARTEAFQSYLKPFIDDGTVAPWTGKVITLEPGKKETKRLWFEPHLVASPNMNSLCKTLAAGLIIKTGVEVAPLSEKRGGAWALTDKDGQALGAFDQVISTAPPVQTLRLFGAHLPQALPLREARLLGCYTLMVGLHTPWHREWIAAKVANHPVAWISVNSSKPGRNKAVTCLVAHMDNQWSEDHIDDDMTQAQAYLAGELEQLTGLDIASAAYLSAHRWRYAVAEALPESAPYVDPVLGLAATGDWCASASRIEDVWAAAMQLARQLA